MTIQEAVVLWALFISIAVSSLHVDFEQDREIELSSPAVMLDSIQDAFQQYVSDGQVKGALRRCSGYESDLGQVDLPFLLHSVRTLVRDGGFDCLRCLYFRRILELSEPSAGYFTEAQRRQLYERIAVHAPNAGNYYPPAYWNYRSNVTGALLSAPAAERNTWGNRYTSSFPLGSRPIPYRGGAGGGSASVLFGFPNALYRDARSAHADVFLTHEVEVPLFHPANRIYDGGISAAWWNRDFPARAGGGALSARNRPPHEGATLSLPLSSVQSFDGEPDDSAPFAVSAMPCWGREVYEEGSRFASTAPERDRAVEFPPSLERAGALPRVLSDAASLASTGEGAEGWMDLSKVVAASFVDPNSGTAGFASSPPGSDGFYVVASVRFAGPRSYLDRVALGEFDTAGGGEYELIAVAIGREPLTRRVASEILAQSQGSWGFVHSPDANSVRGTAHDLSWEVGLTPSDVLARTYRKNFHSIEVYPREFARMHPVLCMRMALAAQAASGRLPVKASGQMPWGYLAGTHVRLSENDFRMRKVKMPSSVSAGTLLGMPDSPRSRCGLPPDSSKGYFMLRLQGSAY